MAEEQVMKRVKIRKMSVLLLTCLLCVGLGLLMGLSISVPSQRQHSDAPEQHEEDKGIVLLSSYLSSKEFDDLSSSYLNYPGVGRHSVMGTPLKIIKIKLFKSVKNDLSKKDALLLEKGLMDVDEALLSDFTGVPEDVCDAYRYSLYSLLGVPGMGPDSKTAYAFGLTGDDSRSVEGLVLFVPYPNLEIVQLSGDINSEIFNISTCR